MVADEYRMLIDGEWTASEGGAVLEGLMPSSVDAAKRVLLHRVPWESHLPFGGRAGSRSGVGRVGGRFAMERLTELKTIVVNLG
jgi:hypothetical protein